MLDEFGSEMPLFQFHAFMLCGHLNPFNQSLVESNISLGRPTISKKDVKEPLAERGESRDRRMKQRHNPINAQ